MNYRIVTAHSTEQLAKRVNEAVTEGWEPVGGVALDASHEDSVDFVAQAMIRTGLWLEQGHKLGSFEVEKIESTPEPELVPAG